jgi:hypothetical protein
MRLPAFVVIATVGVTAGQVPVIQTQPVIPSQQPPRDVVRRAEPTGPPASRDESFQRTGAHPSAARPYSCPWPLRPRRGDPLISRYPRAAETNLRR